MSATRLSDLKKNLALKENELQLLRQQKIKNDAKVVNKLAKLLDISMDSTDEDIAKLEIDIAQLKEERETLEHENMLDSFTNHMAGIRHKLGDTWDASLGFFKSKLTTKGKVEKHAMLAETMRDKYHLSQKH